MNITNDQLNEIVLAVAATRFGVTVFRRRPLMRAVEAHVRQLGRWTPDDDVLSTSAGAKSEGLAKIDWSITHLKERGRLLNIARDQWRLPPSTTPK